MIKNGLYYSTRAKWFLCLVQDEQFDIAYIFGPTGWDSSTTKQNKEWMPRIMKQYDLIPISYIKYRTQLNRYMPELQRRDAVYNFVKPFLKGSYNKPGEFKI